MAKKFLNITVIATLALILLSCLKEENLKLPFTPPVPIQTDDGWPISTPASQSMDTETLYNIIEDFCIDKNCWQTRSLIVARHGCLIAESYMKDPSDQYNPCAVWSCTKQILALLTYMAIENGYLADIDLCIEQFLPEQTSSHPDKKGITLRHLLTMTSGIGFNNSGLNGDTNRLLRREPKNSVNYILSLPMHSIPGERFNYNDGDPQIVSAILASLLGMSVKQWSFKHLFNRMSITNYEWLDYPDGITLGAFGLMLTPRDLTKFGQLVLDGGIWNGKRILSEESIAAIIHPQIEPGQTNYLGQSFGLYWWIDTGRNIAYMHGQGGQYVLIDKINDIVVSVTSEPNTQGIHQFSPTQMFALYDKIKTAIRK